LRVGSTAGVEPPDVYPESFSDLPGRAKGHLECKGPGRAAAEAAFSYRITGRPDWRDPCVGVAREEGPESWCFAMAVGISEIVAVVVTVPPLILLGAACAVLRGGRMLSDAEPSCRRKHAG